MANEVEILLRARDEASATVQKVRQEFGAVSQSVQPASGALHGLGQSADEAAKHLGSIPTAARPGGAALNELRGHAQSLNTDLLGLGKVAAGFVGATVLVGGALSISAAFKGAIDQTVQLGQATLRMQRELGTTAETASGLLAVFRRYGVEGDEASRALGIFAKHIHGLEDESEKAIEGGKGFAGTMRDLGVKFTDVSGNARPMEQVLLEVADRFKDLPNGVDKTALAMELFGRSGKNLLLVLNQGSEGIREAMATAQKYGLVLSGENVEAIRKFGLAHKDLDEAVGGLSIQLGLVFMPLLTNLAKLTAELAATFNERAVPALHALGRAFDVAKQSMVDLGAVADTLARKGLTEQQRQITGATAALGFIHTALERADMSTNRYGVTVDALTGRMLTQEEIAERLGVSQADLARVIDQTSGKFQANAAAVAFVEQATKSMTTAQERDSAAILARSRAASQLRDDELQLAGASRQAAAATDETAAATAQLFAIMANGQAALSSMAGVLAAVKSEVERTKGAFLEQGQAILTMQGMLERRSQVMASNGVRAEQDYARALRQTREAGDEVVGWALVDQDALYRMDAGLKATTERTQGFAYSLEQLGLKAGHAGGGADKLAEGIKELNAAMVEALVLGNEAASKGGAEDLTRRANAMALATRQGIAEIKGEVEGISAPLQAFLPQLGPGGRETFDAILGFVRAHREGLDLLARAQESYQAATNRVIAVEQDLASIREAGQLLDLQLQQRQLQDGQRLLDLKKESIQVEQEIAPIRMQLAGVDAQIRAAQRENLDLKRQGILLEQAALPLRNQIAAIEAKAQLLQRENLDLKRRAVELEQQMAPLRSQLAGIDSRMQLAQRENLDLVRQQLEAAQALLPKREALLDIERRIADVQDRGLDLTRRADILKVQQTTLPLRHQLADVQRAISEVQTDQGGMQANSPEMLQTQAKLKVLEEQRRALERQLEPYDQQIEAIRRIQEETSIKDQLTTLGLEREKLAATKALQASQDKVDALAREREAQGLTTQLVLNGLAREKQAIEDLLRPLQEQAEAIARAKEVASRAAELAVIDLDKEKRTLQEQLRPIQEKLDALERTRTTAQLSTELTVTGLELEKRRLEDQLQPLLDRKEGIARTTEAIQQQSSLDSIAFEKAKLQNEIKRVDAELRLKGLEAERKANQVVFAELVDAFQKTMTAEGVFTEQESKDFLKRLGFWTDEIGKVVDLRSALAQAAVATEALKVAIEAIPSAPPLEGSSYRIEARAAGGPVAAGLSYLIGERGPELFVPRQGGTIVPLGGATATTAATGGGIDYDRLAAALARQLAGVSLSVAVDDIHGALIRKQRANGSLGWVVP